MEQLSEDEQERLRKELEDKQRKEAEKQVRRTDFELGRQARHLRIPGGLPRVDK